MATGDEIIGELLEIPEDGEEAGRLSYALLREIFGGYSPESLQSLMDSDKDFLVDSASWIFSELGSKSSPYLQSIAFLLSHRSHRARFWAIEAVHAAAGPGDGRIIAQAFSLIADPTPQVRWEVMNFLSGATTAQLESSLPYLRDGSLSSPVSWLASISDNHEADKEIKNKLSSSSSIDRRIAVAAAARSPSGRRPLLEYAATLSDPEVQNFAESALRTMN
ncbi:hypothetical protein J4573_09680 [Actinomadura barringtoniae]|uniref:HEAT repeat domain-containing protein n=1 Tax=Actinomadura barringtoniae TaxID=1427535 RepID=A0A939T3X1_9ACTN|nr:hypothetical protein [Actinomadura barringtoniae]MBO2447354.1 hypothetical protein [Actinomadura barringtoniae]